MTLSIKKSQFNYILMHDLSVSDMTRVLLSGDIGERAIVVTPNIDHFCRLDAKTDIRFNDAYINSDIRVCDSRIVRLLSHLENEPIKKICPGSDLTRSLILSKDIRTKSILVIGSHPELVKQLSILHSLQNIECYSPPMGFINNSNEVAKCAKIINSSTAEIVFLALGSPQQEILAHIVKSKATPESSFRGVMLCVGASLDFLTGKSKRAPLFMQRLHLEWLHRALSNPTRLLPRYFYNFLWILRYSVRSIVARLINRQSSR